MAAAVTKGLAIWRPQEQSRWQKFRRDPITQTGFWLYDRRHQLPISGSDDTDDAITVVCVSDTHLSQPSLPDGDLLLHAGDLTNQGSFEEIQTQLDWLASLPHKHKVVIAGNHDRLLDAAFVEKFPDRICETAGAARADLNWHDLVYLQNTTTTITFANGRSLKIYGSPETPECGVFAFQYPPIRDVWTDVIPLECDIVLTHGPAKGYLDQQGKGCPYLMTEVARKRPRLVVCGHIHAGHGKQVLNHQGIDHKYQQVLTGHAGIWTIVSMSFLFLIAWISNLGPVSARRKRQRETILVNAALGSDAIQNGRHAIVLQI